MRHSCQILLLELRKLRFEATAAKRHQESHGRCNSTRGGGCPVALNHPALDGGTVLFGSADPFGFHTVWIR